MTPHQILLKYWGYAQFRPLQEEIIQSVLQGNDTLALLPTGGGKSLCFQVPAIAREGMCLVISPLIALMKDQVDNLKKRGVPAAAIYSGMHPGEISLILGNARNQAYKLLYVSPERLATERFREALTQMRLNLLAIDEAHCVSQWGYDFRPPYLRIAETRKIIPGIPALALTATATPPVVDDIMKQLGFRSGMVFRKSFERKNLTYIVIREEDKRKRLIRILKKVKGSGIIYVRNRRETKETAEFLSSGGIRAGYYHAGLDQRTRDARQQAWIREETRIIVATNAFGMGIDKPNVRIVIHLDLPDCIEAYFQEAGRAGRDEKHAWAVLLNEKADLISARQNLVLSYPEPATIKAVYQALGNFFQLPVGSGKDAAFEIDLSRFASHYRFSPVIAFNAMKFLEKEGYLMLTDALLNPSRIFVKANREDIYRLQVKNPLYDKLLKSIFRSYTGLFSDFTRIRESDIAKNTGMNADEVIIHLRRLEKLGILDYTPQTEKPRVIFLEERLDTRDIVLSPEHYSDRLREADKRLQAMIGYAGSDNKCRSQLLLSYFGETQTTRCGRCDVCLERNKLRLNQVEFDSVVSRIKPLLKTRACSLEEIIDAVGDIHEDKLITVIRFLSDNGKIIFSDGKYSWKG